MKSPFENRALQQYLRNILRSPYNRPLAQRLGIEIECHSQAYGLGAIVNTGSLEMDQWIRAPEARHWKELGRLLDGALARPCAPSALEHNLGILGELFELDALELRIVGLCARYVTDEIVQGLVDVIMKASGSQERTLSSVLSESHAQITRRLAPGSLLSECGVLADKRLFEVCKRPIFEAMPYSVREALVPPRKSAARMGRLLAPSAPKPSLRWSDYEHVAKDRDLIASVLAGALERREKGVNVLIFGPAGTGKTELAALLAKKLEVRLTAVGEGDEDGGEPTRIDRVTALKAASAIARRSAGQLLLFDDMDDLLSREFHGSERGGSRVYLHRILERNATPTIWTCNHVSAFDQAVLRRMTVVAELPIPPARARLRVLSRVLKRHRVELDDVSLQRMAREYPVAPALAANAARAASLAKGGKEEVLRVLESAARLATGRRSPASEPPQHPVALELLRADVEVHALTARILRAPTRQFSLCLSGPPGTGKSSYVRHLADELGLELVHKRASDLLSMYVGGSEKNIAQAFREAADAHAFLVFDEADSLLRERALAERSWEVTQVNEMLTWMESHPLPFACTTNAAHELDAACLRRFTFKIELGYLSQAQVAAAFGHFFGLEAPKAVLALTTLTPGDFAVVRKRAYIEGCTQDTTELGRLLATECAHKRVKGRAIGFSSG